MASSNPAFGRGYARAINSSQQGAWGQTAPTQYDPYNAPSPYARSAVRYMTMDDVVTKTGVSFLVTVLAAAATWGLLPQSVALGLALPAALVGLVIGLVIAFRAIANPAATLAYAAVQGVFLGAISEVFNQYFPGVVVQAVIGTFGVFAGMLVVYKTGAIRVTPKFTRWLLGAMIGALVLMGVNLIAGLFGLNLHLRDGSGFAILFSIVVIAIAALSLLLDFDMADEAIRRGAPARFAWYIAFGLLVTVIWLYLEILRLLSYFRQ